ncbi:3-oxoacyl-ACP reductase [Fibrobacter sp. UWB2]|uniref:SDR family NAD(P)-dependent oxidoreductase n=1 Tax=Fibrobacter sp. UWB2 TaxID=1964358 RepID=UPI000B52452F|nr:SDR family oxidoreductase [Fibrobacter sp. UWB2]OWV24474.1 3-oxoacyl-ACP reductase [Fibrobacter sp. UWB2]
MSYNPFSLEGKKILVTGASSGIGRTTAIECSKMGATVYITARNEARLKETFDSLDRSFAQDHQMILAELSNENGIAALVDALPALEGVSLNAGIVKTLPVKFINNDDLSEVLNVNMIGPVLLTQRLLKKKKLSKGSSVVFTSSIGGVMISTIGNTMYGISKGGLNAFMKGFALEMAKSGIRGNSVNPGLVSTNILAAGTISDDQLKENVSKYPLGRLGKPEDIAHAIIYLLSDASSWVTGHTLVVDGGVILK